MPVVCSASPPGTPPPAKRSRSASPARRGCPKTRSGACSRRLRAMLKPTANAVRKPSGRTPTPRSASRSNGHLPTSTSGWWPISTNILGQPCQNLRVPVVRSGDAIAWAGYCATISVMQRDATPHFNQTGRRRKALRAVAHQLHSIVLSMYNGGRLRDSLAMVFLLRDTLQQNMRPRPRRSLVLVPLFDERPFHILTVTEVTRDIKELLEDTFASVWVEGEISNWRV